MIQNTPLVSVVMSCYNGEMYLKKTIESILNQSYSNFEFIIWDDGSTDSSRTIIESFNDKRIRYYYHENTGLGQTLHLACEKATGKYIARIDGDDIAYYNRFEKEVNYLESHSDYVLVSSAVDYIDDEGNIIGRSLPCTLDKILRGSIYKSNMIVHPMVMMRNDAYLKTGGYAGVYYYEDRLLWNRLAMYGKFHNIPTPLGQYRLLRSSLSRCNNSYRKVLSEFISKMIKDPILIESDIELYNSIYRYSKTFGNAHEVGFVKRKTSFNYRVYKFLSPVLGKIVSQAIVICFTNLYHLFRLNVR